MVAAAGLLAAPAAAPAAGARGGRGLLAARAVLLLLPGSGRRPPRLVPGHVAEAPVARVGAGRGRRAVAVVVGAVSGRLL